MLLCFKLSMPNKASWNGRWSGEGKLNAAIVRLYKKDISETLLNQILDTKNFYYRWDDGWTACVTVTKVDSKEAAKIRKNNVGFCGYNWMIKSILEHGEIRKR